MFNYLCTSCVLRTSCRLQNLQSIKSIRFRTFSYTMLYSTSCTRNSSTHVFSASNINVASMKKIANQLGVDHDFLVDTLKNSPNLVSVSPLQWETCFRELTNNGYSIEDSLHMIKKYPPVLESKDLSIVFKHWRGVEFGEKNVLSLLKTHPQFLLLRGQQVSFRVGHLKPLGSNKDIVNLLKNAPCLMFENWNDVLAKIAFLVDEVRIERKQILKSFALNRTLFFLKARFVFLERCGKYVKPNLDPDPNIQSKNPPLKSIVEDNDEKFATQVAGVTLEEYEVFQELYAIEVEESEKSGSDSE